jgi:hypothetical protein
MLRKTYVMLRRTWASSRRTEGTTYGEVHTHVNIAKAWQAISVAYRSELVQNLSSERLVRTALNMKAPRNEKYCSLFAHTSVFMQTGNVHQITISRFSWNRKRIYRIKSDTNDVCKELNAFLLLLIFILLNSKSSGNSSVFACLGLL